MHTQLSTDEAPETIYIDIETYFPHFDQYCVETLNADVLYSLNQEQNQKQMKVLSNQIKKKMMALNFAEFLTFSEKRKQIINADLVIYAVLQLKLKKKPIMIFSGKPVKSIIV